MGDRVVLQAWRELQKAQGGWGKPQACPGKPVQLQFFLFVTHVNAKQTELTCVYSQRRIHFAPFLTQITEWVIGDVLAVNATVAILGEKKHAWPSAHFLQICLESELHNGFVVCCVPSMCGDLQGPHWWRGMLKCKKCLFYCTLQVEGATATACLDMV